MQTSSRGYDPSTGITLPPNELDALLLAAGAEQTPANSFVPVGMRSSGALKITLVATEQVIDEFFTDCKEEAAGRMCTFLSRVVDTSSHVRIELGSQAAMATLHPNGHSYNTCFMDRALCSVTQEPPSVVTYAPDALHTWAQSVARMFLNLQVNRLSVKHLQDLWLQRQASFGRQVQMTPLCTTAV